MTSQMESFSCNLVERILFPNSETSRPPRNFTAAITQAITLCPGELACFYECRAVAGGQLSSDVMEKWYLKILGPISEIKEQQNIHSILVLRNACGGGFPNYSLFVHFCVTTYHLVSTRFFWDLKKKKNHCQPCLVSVHRLYWGGRAAAGSPVSSTAEVCWYRKVIFTYLRRQLTRQSKWRGPSVCPPHSRSACYRPRVQRAVQSQKLPAWFLSVRPVGWRTLIVPQRLAAFWVACLLLMELSWFLTKCKEVVLPASSQKMKNNAFDIVSRILK